MNDRAIVVLEQYALQPEKVRKGRGTFLFESEGKNYVMEEYHGNQERLEFVSEVLESAHERGISNVERFIVNAEGELLSKDFEQTNYLVKTHFPGKECDLTDVRQCERAMETLAYLHLGLQGCKENVEIEKLPFLREIEKHNRELQRVRKFLKKKGQKTEFELFLLKYYDMFFEEAKMVLSRLMEENTDDWLSDIRQKKWISHGDYEHHNILMDQSATYLINFERIVVDNPIRDIYLFMRKLLEKNDWNPQLYEKLIRVYENVRNLDERDICQLKYHFWYPEKFWKIVNFYYNNSKAWMSYKNTEKLEKFLSQNQYKKDFMEKIFS